jgi:hypothetical protein
MEIIRYELKYCEGCGTLKLRPVLSANNHCMICERLLERFGFRRKIGAPNLAELSLPAERNIPVGIPRSDRRSATARSAQ